MGAHGDMAVGRVRDGSKSSDLHLDQQHELLIPGLKYFIPGAFVYVLFGVARKNHHIIHSRVPCERAGDQRKSNAPGAEK